MKTRALYCTRYAHKSKQHVSYRRYFRAGNIDLKVLVNIKSSIPPKVTKKLSRKSLTHAWPFKICFYWQSRAWWFRIFPCVNAVPVYKRKQNEAQLPILTEQFNYIYAVIAKPLSEHKLRLCMLQLIWYSNYSRHLLIIWKRGIIFVMIKLTFSYYISVINSSLFIFIEWINMSCYSIYNTIVMVKN